MSLNKKVAFHTLGCKLNFSETSTIARLFENKGFEKVPFNSKADIYIINTCTVTAQADSKCRNAISRAHRQNPDAFIAVIGCYAQLKPKEIVDIPGVDIVLGANEKFNLFTYIDNLEKKKVPEIHSCEIEDVNNFFPAYSSNDRTRSFLKVQDGCDYECAYCTIPKARGKSRNQSIEETVKTAKEAINAGAKEIILTGVNIGDFGRSTNENFLELIKELDKLPVDRYRISSIEPNLINDDVIKFCAESKSILPHFHIPLQSGSDSILAMMKRRYNTKMYSERIATINKLIPNAGIGVDVIVGFPGETDELFNETYNFINSLDISYLHVFSYSERPGTASAKMKNKIPGKTIQERSKRLHILSDKKKRAFYEKNIGKTFNVLFESMNKENGLFSGFTENYINVEMPSGENLKNKIVKVKITGINERGNASAELVL